MILKLLCWRRLLRVPWTARRSEQSILKEVNPEYSLKWLMMKLKLQYFGHLMQGKDSLEKTLMLEKIESRRRKGWQRMRWLDGMINSMDISLSKLWEMEGQGSLATTVHGVTKSRTLLSNWTTNLKEGFPCWLSGKYCMNAVQSLDQKEPLEKEITTHSSVLAWETPWTKEPGGLQFMRSQQHWTQLSD